MDSIASAAIPMLNDFKFMEIASILWSIYCLGEAASVADGPSSHLLALASAPAVLAGGGERRGHSLCILANALHPLRDQLDPDLWAAVEAEWLNVLNALAGAVHIREGDLPLDEEVYVQRLSSLGCFHAGPHYTRQLLSSIGLGAPTSEFTVDARAAVATFVAERGGVAKAGISCVADYAIVVGTSTNTQRSSGRRLIESGGSATDDNSSKGEVCCASAPLLVAAPLAHDRGGHAELAALRQVLRAAHLAGHKHGTSCEGEVSLFVEHPPCLSCIGAMAQFHALLPGVALLVSFDWSPSTTLRGSAGSSVVADESL